MAFASLFAGAVWLLVAVLLLLDLAGKAGPLAKRRVVGRVEPCRIGLAPG